MTSRCSGPSVSAGSAIRGSILVLIVASLVLFPSVASSVRAAQTQTVYMGDNFFQPQTVYINVGDTILWNNNGSVVHTATSAGGQAVSWDSRDMSPGQTYPFTFNVIGNFSYYCIYHPGMTGTVVVQAPVPEFPGVIALATVGVAVFIGLALERALRLHGLA